FSGLSGSAVWAHSTRWFTGCERDRGVRRVLNATTLKGQPNRDQEALLGQGGAFAEVFRRFEVLEVVFGVVSPRGRRTERGKRRVVIVLCVLREGRVILPIFML
ncbi:hypothetical protein Taro_034771, partial [Colocasia esculenta]|nr:hypothetical protein [Colocasia esculenta]